MNTPCGDAGGIHDFYLIESFAFSILPPSFHLTNPPEAVTIFVVSASEIIQELPKLNDAERQAVLDKLRELAQVDEERWEEIINEPRPRPKLEAFFHESAAEGGEEPLDPDRL